MDELERRFERCLRDRGDVAAQAELVNHPWLRSMAWRELRRAPPLGWRGAEDLIQDARLAAIRCVADYRWICPRCGQRYGTFGFRTDPFNRRVFRVCYDPDCRWHAHVDAYAGPPRGRQRHGGQRVSPVTGRALTKTP